MLNFAKYENWYRKWGKNYFRYMAVQIGRVALVLLVLLTIRDILKIIRGKTTIISLYHPVKFYFLTVLLIPLMVHFHERWKLMRLKYHLSKSAPPAPAELYRQAEKITGKYRYWKKHSVKLILLNGLIAPVLFLFSMYILITIKYRNFSIRTFTNEFEWPALPAVFVIFYVFGIFITWKYWKEYLSIHYEEIVYLNNPAG